MITLNLMEGTIQPGSCELSNTLLLKAHHGSQPDLFLAWTALPSIDDTVDVVLYFHGFALTGGATAPLSEFVGVGGFDSQNLMAVLARRSRPIVVIVPRGDASQSNPDAGPWPYKFPALANGGAGQLISEALHQLADARLAVDASSPPQLKAGRLICMAHSGGGQGLLIALPALVPPPDEIYLFDALYHDPDPSLTQWVRNTLEMDSTRVGRLWVGYRKGEGTARFSENLRAFIDGALGQLGISATDRIREWYDVESVADAHMDIPRHYAPILLGPLQGALV